jgi:hypothetical protein
MSFGRYVFSSPSSVTSPSPSWLSVNKGSRREVVWASLPEQTREAVLVLLARLIGAGAVEDEDGV